MYFLQSFASAQREHTNLLLRAHESGQLSVPVSVETRRQMYRKLQTQILRAPPFHNTAALVATNHCMHLLVSLIRYTIAPDSAVDETWINALLTWSPFTRIVEFFSAEIGDGGNQRIQRKEFMYNFHRDMTIHEKDHMRSLIFGPANSDSHRSVRDVWFDAASLEMEVRRARPHHVETVWTWNGLPIVLGCPDCRPAPGWRA